MANILILNFCFKDDNDGTNDFSLNINTQNIQSVDDLKNVLVTGGRVTYNNFDLYRNNFGKDVKEHMKLSIEIRKYFSESPDIKQPIFTIKPNIMSKIVDTSTSTSTTVAENEMVLLADEIKKYDTRTLISFLRRHELELNETAIKILEKEELTGRAFLKTTEEKLCSYGMPEESVSDLADFAKECKEKKLRSFSSYKTKKDLKEVLAKYGVKDVRELTGKKISLNPQFEVVGEENMGHVNYAIKAFEELICITEDRISCMSRNSLNICFVKTALKEGSEDEKELCMESEIDSLRQRITELEAEKAELKVELEAKNSEIPELKKKLAEVKARNSKLIKQIMEENNRHDARIEDTTDRILKLEQLQNNNTPNNNSPNFNLVMGHHEKSLEDRETDDFLNEVHKKRISNDIRQRNKEKKLQRDQNKTSDTVYVMETVNNVEKSHEPEINNCTSSHGVEVIVDIFKEQTQKSIANFSILSRDIKPINKVNRFFKKSKLSHEKETITNTSSTLTKVDSERLENDERANDMKRKIISAKRSEIMLWHLFSERFEDKVMKLRSNDKKLTDQTARKQIYNEMKPYLTGASDGYLRIMTCKARKINKLFGYEYDPVTLKKNKGIPGYMVQRVTCNADRISRLTNPQIEYIIEQVKSKTITDQSHVNEISESMANTSANDPNSDDNFSDTSDATDYFKEEEGTNKSTKEVSKKFEVSAPTIPISASPSNSLKAVDDYYKMILEDCVKDYNDSDSNNSKKEIPDDSDNDGYNGYGRYNEYGECDKGYYYHDGRYESKASLMMSPIIFPGVEEPFLVAVDETDTINHFKEDILIRRRGIIHENVKTFKIWKVFIPVNEYNKLKNDPVEIVSGEELDKQRITSIGKARVASINGAGVEMDYYLEKICKLGVIKVGDELHIDKNYNHHDQAKVPKSVKIGCKVIGIDNGIFTVALIGYDEEQKSLVLLEIWLLNKFNLNKQYRPKYYGRPDENIDIIRNGEDMGILKIDIKN
ncbi:hypothetical protein C1645_822583 [Glomus cerebriforme]|uniref:Uncharacterized protein n=1 Tax=Glomus cerebriforme TaxID=658196 RepID=A0A397T109_9GLOM|nr:hypothetical protein C1645_822583 [Glomus cerebriforme]